MKKDDVLNEKMSEVEANSVVIDENNKNEKTINKEDVKGSGKKKKKHSNAKTAFIVLGGTILLVVVAMIATGGWNPFKSNEVTKEAKVAYEQYDEKFSDIGKKIDKIAITSLNGDYTDDDIAEYERSHGPDGMQPYGFRVEDYGSSGKDGILKYMRDVRNVELEENFGATLQVYYMINEDYAKEKYASMKGSYLGAYAKEYDIKNGKVGFGQSSDYNGGFILVRQGTVIYYGISGNNTQFNKLQKWFDLIGVDFKFTSVKEIFGK